MGPIDGTFWKRLLDKNSSHGQNAWCMLRESLLGKSLQRKCAVIHWAVSFNCRPFCLKPAHEYSMREIPLYMCSEDHPHPLHFIFTASLYWNISSALRENQKTKYVFENKCEMLADFGLLCALGKCIGLTATWSTWQTWMEATARSCTRTRGIQLVNLNTFPEHFPLRHFPYIPP